MRTFFAVGLGCFCTLAAAADRQSQAAAASQNPPDVTIDDLLDRIDEDFQSPLSGLKCELLAVNPKKIKDVFGARAWVALGKADISPTLWESVLSPAIDAALTPPPPPPPFLWYSPSIGLRADIADDTPSVPAGEYLLLVFFDEGSAKLYFNGEIIKDTQAITDNRPWRDILTNAGISLTPKSASSN
jgi:hypothetical protein